MFVVGIISGVVGIASHKILRNRWESYQLLDEVRVISAGLGS